MGAVLYRLIHQRANTFTYLRGPPWWIAISCLAVTEWSISLMMAIGLNRFAQQTQFQPTRQLIGRLIV